MRYCATIATTMITAARAKIALVEAATITRLRSYPCYLPRKRYAGITGAGDVRSNAGRRLVRRVDTGLLASMG